MSADGMFVLGTDGILTEEDMLQALKVNNITVLELCFQGKCQGMQLLFKELKKAGIIFLMQAANERQCYNVTSSFIGWACTQNDP